MRRPSRKGLSWAFVLCANISLTAQNLQSIGKENPLSFSGGISFNQVFYSSSGAASRRDPYNYFASGHANLAVYGWSIPFSFSVSRAGTSFTQPFNQYAIHPSWKSLTAHIGNTSMVFSPYTVNGHLFLGGGVEIAPQGKWKISALYGRFLRAVEADTASATTPSFQRDGYGIKTSYGGGRNFVDVILFRAADRENSIAPLPDSISIAPQENLVFSIGGGKSVFTHFVLRAEMAASAISRDIRAPITEHDHPLARSSSLFQPRTSSSYNHAFKSSFDYQRDGWIIGVAYERIAPEYRTLGSYYFNNDLENMTLNATAPILQGKMNIAARAGLQRDNLDNMKMSTMRRMVGSLHAGYIPSPRLNLSASWSSFQTFTNIRSRFEILNELTPYDNLDTLNFTQVSRNASFTGAYTFRGNEIKRQQLHLSLSWQDAAESQDREAQHSGTTFFNATAGYALALSPRHLTFALNFNTTVNTGPFATTHMAGPHASVSRSFFSRKLRTTFSSSWNNTYTNGARLQSVMNGRLNGTLSLKNKHNLTFSTVLVKRMAGSESTSRSSAEFTATVGYSYGFAMSRNTGQKTRNPH